MSNQMLDGLKMKMLCEMLSLKTSSPAMTGIYSHNMRSFLNLATMLPEALKGDQVLATTLVLHVQQDIDCIVEHLTESLRRYESAPITKLRGEWHFTAQIKIALSKAEDYYTKLDDSAAYLAAIVLHPKYKWDYIESQWSARRDWAEQGKCAV